SLRSAESWARYDFTVLLEKSTFLPGAGLVFEYVESGSPLSWTMALPVSTPPDGSAPSVVPRDPPTSADAPVTKTSPAASEAAASEPAIFFKFFPPLDRLTAQAA